MKNNFLQDHLGKSSSKRVFGSLLIIIGIIFSFIVFYLSVFQNITNTSSALQIINLFLISGGGLLGVGTFEFLKK